MRCKDWALLVFYLFLFTGIVSTPGTARRVAESLKPLGRSVELLLEPGTYRIYMVQEDERLLGSISLETGDWVVLHLNELRPVDREPATIREAQPRAARSAAEHRRLFNALSLAKRHRIEFRVGYWDSGSHQETRTACSDLVDTEVRDLLGAFSYAYWIREDLSVHTTFRGLVAEARSTSGWSGGCENSVVVSSLILGIRQYPLSAPTSPVRPYLTAGIGPYWGVESWNGNHFEDSVTTRTEASFGGHLGGGLDIQMGRHLMAGINVGYNLMADFPAPLDGEKNYGGVEIGVGLSLLLGSGAR